MLASNLNRLFLHTKQYHFQCSSKRTRKEDLKRLPKLQNKCVRLICQIPRSDHITPSLEQLHWLPISDRIIHKTVLHVFKSLHGLSPLYINSCLKIRSRPSSVSTRSINHIFLEASRSKKLQVTEPSVCLHQSRRWRIRSNKPRNRSLHIREHVCLITRHSLTPVILRGKT